MAPLETKPVPKLHNELRIRLLERIVFINVLPIVIQIAAGVPAQSRFQHAAGCRSCSDDYYPANVITVAV